MEACQRGVNLDFLAAHLGYLGVLILAAWVFILVVHPGCSVREEKLARSWRCTCFAVPGITFIYEKGENSLPSKDSFYPWMQKRILSSFQKCAFQFSKSKNENEFEELLIFIHAGMSYFWWKLENCFSFLWKQMFKMFKGPATDSIPGQFFPAGKTISLCLRQGFKINVVIVSHIRLQLWNVGQKDTEGSSKYAAWSMRVEEEADFWWWSPLRKMFCSRLKWRYLSVASGDIQICAVNRSKISSIGFSLDPVLPLISDILFRHKAKALQMWLLVA